MEQKKKTINDLNKWYSEASEIDSSIFSEMRSNVLLVSGDHYTRKSSNFWSRIRDNQQLTEEQKLRLTKNHIHKIASTYVNNIFSLAPGVSISPKNEKEIQDQKNAELNSAVWEDYKVRHDYRKKLRQRVEDFIKVGEVAVKVFWDPYAGRFMGYEQAVDEMGQPLMDENGFPAADKSRPLFSGDIVIERIFAPNLLRDPNSKSMEDGMLCYRKMVNTKSLEKIYAGDEEKLKFLKSSNEDVYTVFEGSSGSYHRTKDQVMIREYYEPPCPEYPEGYFWITTEGGVLEEGPLPFGIFPILHTGFDEVQTTPRKRSLIKHLRPYQAEINRCASAIATHQITLGDDKLVVQTGSRVTQSAKLPGVRVLSVSGEAPTIMPGRSGDQYLDYMQSQILEMYQVANLSEDLQEKQIQTNDPFSELFKAIRHKKKFSVYAEEFMNFEIRICETVLQIARKYYPDDMLIPAIGRSEIVNISEFRSTEPLQYQVRVEESSDDFETKMGKQLTLTHTLQYMGSKLEKDDIGRILRVMPYTNKEQIFSDFTTDYDNATNEILSLDRGEYPPVMKYENHEYHLKRLINRTKQSDFMFLPPEIQGNYYRRIEEHEMVHVNNLQEIKKQQAEFIPASGPLIAVDFYVKDPEKPDRTRRARIPSDAVNWLIQQLEAQGTSLDQLARLEQDAVADIARKMTIMSQPGAVPVDNMQGLLQYNPIR